MNVKLLLISFINPLKSYSFQLFGVRDVFFLALPDADDSVGAKSNLMVNYFQFDIRTSFIASRDEWNLKRTVLRSCQTT